MSREELVQKFGELIWTRVILDREDADKVAELIAPEIERLLADEREKAAQFEWNLAHEPAKCGHARANWKDPQWGTPEYKGHEKCEACQAIAAERERVREMCAVEILKRAGELRDLLKTIEESCGPGDVDAETERLRMENRAEELELVAAGIRQLNLTKDLAPSTEKVNG